MRLIWIFLSLATLMLIPFLIWGEGFEQWWTLEKLGEFGQWAWAAGLALLVFDVLLPVPSTVMMSALGYLYGFWLGGLLAAIGGILSGLLGYGLCRLLGERAVLFLLGRRGLEQGREWFGRFGTWLIAVSRWLPLLGEVTACLAGLTRMPLGRFITALACGCIPMGFSFAFIGHMGSEKPQLALLISAFAPPLLWLISSRLLPHKSNS